MGVELAGKTLGLIGCGNIGSIVADRAHGLKMKVVAYDPFLSPERAVELGVDKVELDELLARADFITLHTPLTDQTRGILSREALGEDQAGRADRQLRARRTDRRGCAQGRARKRPGRGRGARRVRGGAGEGEPAVRHARPDLHAASRRVDQRGAGQRRDPGRRADERFPAARRHYQRGERAVAVRGGSAAAQALHGPGGEARAGSSGRSPAPRSARSTSRSKARPPSSTSSRSPARCLPA